MCFEKFGLFQFLLYENIGKANLDADKFEDPQMFNAWALNSF